MSIPTPKFPAIEALSDLPSHRDAGHAGRLAAVCISAGGIPKLPMAEVLVGAGGLAGDGHAHAKHNRTDRAVSLFDIEILQQLVREGFPLSPGAAGENLTVEGLNVQEMQPGTILEIGDVQLRLEAPRKPCYVLDAIDPQLKEAIVGRCGYMASVLRGGVVQPNMPVRDISRHSPRFAQEAGRK